MIDIEYSREINRKLELATIATIENIIFSILMLQMKINPTLGEHQKRVAIVCYYLARKFNFANNKMSVLILSALIHDIGYTDTDSKELLKDKMENIEDSNNLHSELGAKMALSKSMEKISAIIKYHHIDTREYEQKKHIVPLESLLISFANQVEFLFEKDEVAIKQKLKFSEFVRKRDSYYPDSFFNFLRELENDFEFWYDIDSLTLKEVFNWINMSDIVKKVQFEELEEFAVIYSKIIDYRSKYSISHSNAVANISYKLAKTYGLHESKCMEVKLAGYLNDIGKIIIPVEILEKNSELSVADKQKIQYAKYYSKKIVDSIQGFERISEWIDGQNNSTELDKSVAIEMQIIMCANIICALLEDRAYRPAFSIEKIQAIIAEDLKPKVNTMLFEIIKNSIENISDLQKDIHQKIKVGLGTIYN